MSTHTNGPWTVQEGGGEILAGPEDGFRPFDGCGCCHSPWVNGIDAGQVKANAQLIAAAPELLEALRSLVPQSERVQGPDLQTLEMAKAAIFKATGAAA